MSFLKLQSQGLFKVCITVHCYIPCIFLAQTLYTLDKKSASKWLGENSPNSYTIFEIKSQLSLKFASLFSVMRDNSSVLF